MVPNHQTMEHAVSAAESVFEGASWQLRASPSARRAAKKGGIWKVQCDCAPMHHHQAMSLSRLGRPSWRAAVVCFSAPESQLARFDVRTGPYAPIRGEGMPLRNTDAQERGETPQATSGLFVALTGKSADSALITLDERGCGELSPASSSGQHSTTAPCFCP